jgi:hypothetical protein
MDQCGEPLEAVGQTRAWPPEQVFGKDRGAFVS